MSNVTFASSQLVGHIVGDWRVVESYSDSNAITATGSNFSKNYIVERQGSQAFMKVLDLEKVMLRASTHFLEDISTATNEFKYEQQLSRYCNTQRVSKVISFLDAGEVSLPGFGIGNVVYIVYEIALGDVRRTLRYSTSASWVTQLHTLVGKLHSLHDAAVGLSQLHSIDIAHQDVKPSNILSFDQEYKIGDLGSSLIFNNEVKDALPIRVRGDRTYAAPESFFSDYVPSEEMLYQMDNYMLGGMVCFFFTGLSFNVLMNKSLPPSLSLSNGGFRHPQPYCDAIPDMLNAYQQALQDLGREIPDEYYRERIVRIVAYLCQPDPTRRGHPCVVDIANRTPNYDLQRTISEFNLMHRRALLSLKSNA